MAIRSERTGVQWTLAQNIKEVCFVAGKLCYFHLVIFVTINTVYEKDITFSLLIKFSYNCALPVKMVNDKKFNTKERLFFRQIRKGEYPRYMKRKLIIEVFQTSLKSIYTIYTASFLIEYLWWLFRNLLKCFSLSLVFHFTLQHSFLTPRDLEVKLYFQKTYIYIHDYFCS